MKLTKAKVMISERRIKLKCGKLGTEISNDYKGKALCVVAVSNGAIPFVADLIRRVTVPMRLDTVAVNSYSGETSTGELNVRSTFKFDLSGQDVLIVDDILDTGRTLSLIKEHIESNHSPASVKTCVCLDKPARRVVEFEADYVGFVIPDKFVVGYGLDYDEYYRNLPFVGYLR